ncbi:unnamed protein product, partial [Rotaria sp. Silwood2]
MRGNTYGPSFQRLKSLISTKSKILTEINDDVIKMNEKSVYYLHPTILDTCLQSGLTLLQDPYTYVPVAVDKIMIFSQQQRTLYAYTDFHSPTIGIRKNYKYSSDIVLFENFKMQQLINLHSTIKSIPIFEQFEQEHCYQNEMKYLFNNYCLQMIWNESKIYFDCNQFLLIPKELFNTHYSDSVKTTILVRDLIKNGQSERDH